MKNRFNMAIKKIIAVASAKGGVGKSSITAGLALSMSQSFKVGILDADIYGPNQHILFDVENSKPNLIKKNEKKYFEPIISNNVALNSMGFVLDNDKAAVWRGPMLSGAIRQLMDSTIWGDLDYLFIDMPPGTGDAYLTVASEIKPDYCLLVTTANKLSIHDVHKSITTFNKLNIKILGFIDNNISNYEFEKDFSSFKNLNVEHIGSIPFNKNIYSFDKNNINNLFVNLSSRIVSLV